MERVHIKIHISHGGCCHFSVDGTVPLRNPQPFATLGIHSNTDQFITHRAEVFPVLSLPEHEYRTAGRGREPRCAGPIRIFQLGDSLRDIIHGIGVQRHRGQVCLLPIDGFSLPDRIDYHVQLQKVQHAVLNPVQHHIHIQRHLIMPSAGTISTGPDDCPAGISLCCLLLYNGFTLFPTVPWNLVGCCDERHHTQNHRPNQHHAFHGHLSSHTTAPL